MTMELDLGPEAKKFRDEVRSFLEANQPDGDLRGLDEQQVAFGNSPAAKAWADKLADNGFMCVSWPKEFGGRGLTGIEVAVLNEEFARAHVPRVTRGMGEWLVGPSIIVHGTDEQKAKFLPRIIDGDGPLLPGLLRARRRFRPRGTEDPRRDRRRRDRHHRPEGVDLRRAAGEHDVLPLPHRSRRAETQGHLLRAAADVNGRTARPNGIELRPIKQITGGAGFTETFLTDARAPVANAIGGLHNGWQVTMTTLGNERGGNATTQHVRFTKEFWDLVSEAQKRGKTDDAVMRQELAQRVHQRRDHAVQRPAHLERSRGKEGAGSRLGAQQDVLVRAPPVVRRSRARRARHGRDGHEVD